MKHEPRSPREIKPILAALAEEGTVLLGGQSVSVWSLTYEKSQREPWKSCRPYTSLDVDVLGDRREVVRVAERLEKAGYDVEVYFPLPEESGSPHSGKLVVRRRDFQIEVDFLHTVRGLDAQEIRSQSPEILWEGIPLRILHPLLCVESKTYNLLTLPQDDAKEPRQDHKHLLLSVANLREHLAKHTRDLPEEALNQTAERLLDVAVHQPGLDVKRLHRIDLLDAIPWDAWRKCRRRRLRELARNEDQHRRDVEARIAEMAEIDSWIAKLKAKNHRRPKR